MGDRLDFYVLFDIANCKCYIMTMQKVDMFYKSIMHLSWVNITCPLPTVRDFKKNVQLEAPSALWQPERIAVYFAFCRCHVV